jgi:hypothetical protein
VDRTASAIALVTSNIAEAIKKVEVIMVVLPSSASSRYCKQSHLIYGVDRS